MRRGAIAQLVVRRADNAKVPGSKPGSTNFFPSFLFLHPEKKKRREREGRVLLLLLLFALVLALALSFHHAILPKETVAHLRLSVTREQKEGDGTPSLTHEDRAKGKEGGAKREERRDVIRHNHPHPLWKQTSSTPRL